MRYHAATGYTYMPSTKLRMQGTNGGYLVRTNAVGFRSEREFAPARRPDVFRALLFGDSQTAGDGISNALRYSDLLEKRQDGLEVYNFGLSGSGTDQQLLTYREHAGIEHDLLIIGMYVENIRRLTHRVAPSRDVSGEEVFRAKPYFLLEPDGLGLYNVPVPKQPWTRATLPAELQPHVYAHVNSAFRNPSSWYASALRRLAPPGRVREAVKSMLRKLRPVQPLWEYDSPDSPEWLLMRGILTAWIRESRVPVMLVLIPHETALMGTSDGRKCQARFSELARDTGVQVVDTLPDFLKLDAAERARLWSEATGHLSAAGHEAIAQLLAPQVQRFMTARIPQTAAR